MGMKQEEVLGGEFSSDNYVSERIFAAGRDGIQIPISIVYKKGFMITTRIVYNKRLAIYREP